MRKRMLSRSLFFSKLNQNRMWSRNALFKSHYGLPGPSVGEGSFSGMIRVIFTQAKEKPGINPLATAPTLRRRFATHLLEKGVDLGYIQALPGHERSKTTEINTKITKQGWDKIKSPLDDLELLGDRSILKGQTYVVSGLLRRQS